MKRERGRYEVEHALHKINIYNIFKIISFLQNREFFNILQDINVLAKQVT